MMTRKEIVDFFTTIDIKLSPAGIWDYDLQEGKKPINPNRADYLPLSKHPEDNMFKYRLDDTDYLVVDADGIDIGELENDYPILKDTFFTTTTKPTNRHYYLLPPEGKKWPRNRVVGLEGSKSYDLFTSGLLFEGHVHNKNPNYSIGTKDIKRVDDVDYKNFSRIMKPKNKQSSNYHNTPRVNNFKMRDAVEQYIAHYTSPDDKRKKFTNAQQNNLIRLVVAHEYIEQLPANTKRIPWPSLTHMGFNTIVYKLTYNGAIDHTTRDKFIDLVLIHEYDIDPNSQQTKDHLQKSIYATLPRFNKLSDDQDEYPVQETLKQTQLSDDYACIKTRINRQFMFAEIDPTTLNLRASGKDDELFFNDKVLNSIYQQHLSSSFTLADLISSLPELKIVSFPNLPKTFMDYDNNIECLNISPTTAYKENATPTNEEPDNVVTRAVRSYLNDQAPIYYHWLAHHMWNKKVPQMVPAFVTPKEDGGGTGKTTLAGHLPSRLLGSGVAVKEADVVKGWADTTRGRSLVMINDMSDMSVWDMVYGTIRDATTGGLRRLGNTKYGGFVETTQSTGFAVSANFMLPLEELDRRFWVMKPQHMEGKCAPLNIGDRNDIYDMMEESALTDYHPEIQELANYLRYLWDEKRNEYKSVLGQFAPKTEYLVECIHQGKNHSQQLLSMLRVGPESVEMLLHEDGLNDVIELYRFMIFQYHNTHDLGYVSLPWMVMASLLFCTSHNEHMLDKPASVAAALDVAQSKFKNTGTINHKYRDRQLLIDAGVNPEFADYTVASHYKLEVTEPLMNKYIAYVAAYTADAIIEPTIEGE